MLNYGEKLRLQRGGNVVDVQESQGSKDCSFCFNDDPIDVG